MYDPIEMLLLKLCVQLQHRAWPWFWPQNLLHLPISEGWVKPNSGTHSDTLSFGWKGWTGYTTSFKPRHSAQLIAQCWLQAVLTEVKFIGWTKKRREEKAEEVSMMRHSIHRRHFRAMLYAHLWEATIKNNLHVPLAWPFCIILHRKQTHRFFLFLLWLCNSPV